MRTFQRLQAIQHKLPLAAPLAASPQNRRMVVSGVKRAHAVDKKQRAAAATSRRRRLPDASLDADAARREAAAAGKCASNQADGRRGPQGRRHVAG